MKEILSRFEMKTATLDKISCFLSELIGTALLVFLGCMGCIKIEGIENNHFQSVINFGLTIMIIIQIFGCVSGAHLNPALTAAAYIYKHVTLSMSVIYFVGQMLGGFIGFGLLKALVSAEATAKDGEGNGFCSTVPNPDISVFQALCIEFIISCVLILICCGVWDPRNAKHGDAVPLKFGFGVSALAYVAGPWSGASMNPARSFGPAIWNGDFTHHWIYWVAPMSAGLITSIAYKAVFWRDPQQPDHIKAKELEELKSIQSN